ncbi:helix-turn-helix transcriptional regulator [Spiribacter halobius]|uniref:Transcriptional regulator n=1 Tax=Sediminicurvatus halobius TaxID=2182432 RepID=A0A2U2MY24_9GAMM|nr:helix-turn-helix transcriptional regulator [Spiribacter halobius]PWG61682.1 transcriptional regulator [Spiribacter halobius]UEX77307.1 helix-turn-helix domain-containing protein [Spiribacter halobius]
MAKIHKRTYSRYALEALALLGKSIRLGRMQRRLTAQELAERIGVSRSTLQRIEKGDPRVEIGLVLEAATIVGVKLFDADEKGIAALTARTDDRIALLPRHVYKAGRRVEDEF